VHVVPQLLAKRALQLAERHARLRDGNLDVTGPSVLKALRRCRRARRCLELRQLVEHAACDYAPAFALRGEAGRRVEFLHDHPVGLCSIPHHRREGGDDCRAEHDEQNMHACLETFACAPHPCVFLELLDLKAEELGLQPP